MADSKAAYRYAKALYGLAAERGETETVFNDFKLIDKTVDDNRVLESILASPIIKTDKKLSVINALFSSHVNKTSIEFLRLLTNKGRDKILLQIIKAFNRIYLDKKNIVIANITTALPLDEMLRNQFKDAVKKETGKEVQLIEKVDASIIGGYVLRVGDKQQDASLRAKLTRMERDFKENRFSLS